MHWRDAGPDDAPNAALALSVDTRRPGLVVEASRSRRLRIVAGQRTYLWARVEEGSYGAWVLRSKSLEPIAIVDPIRTGEARARSSISEWTRWFARALERSERSPLRTGDWQLTRLRRNLSTHSSDAFAPEDNHRMPSPAFALKNALELPQCHYIDWGCSGSGEIIPLREPSPADAARVKAWRKHARENTLPPVLLWWVTGLEAYVILDGHDRLRAAQLEGVDPALITLWQPREVEVRANEELRRHFVAAYEQVFENDALSDAARKKLNTQLVDHHRERWRTVMTTSRANDGLDAVWDDEVARETQGDDEAREDMLFDG